ncbi:hypothetical protein assk_168 [Aeromonas phage Assk]|nr:hypothetical protein [Aeromonas phage AS-szw]QAX98960.1 hypothetical protein assk_168 [Aeromonas phage Assk]
METLFALILTSCVIDMNNNPVCETFQVELSTTKEICEERKLENMSFLFEEDRLDCELVKYEKE